MKAVVSREDLLRGLSRVASAVPARAAQPMLEHVVLEFIPDHGGAIRALATDLEIAIVSEVPASIKEAGVLTVPGKILLEGVREMPDGDLELMSGERHALTLKAGKARMTLRGASREDYPKIPLVPLDNPFQVASGVLRDAIRRTIIAASSDNTRTFLTGGNLVITGSQTRLVATDGHRLAISDFPLAEGPRGGKGLNVNVLVPARILGIVASDLGDDAKVRIAVTDTHIVFETPGGTFHSRLIAEKFPDYEKIIPKASERTIELETSAFAAALRRTNPFVNPRTLGVTLAVHSNRIQISAESPELGEATDEVPATCTGGSIEINFRAPYLADACKVIGGESLRIELGAKIAPAVFSSTTNKDYKYILMPLRG